VKAHCDVFKVFKDSFCVSYLVLSIVTDGILSIKIYLSYKENEY